MKRYIIGALIGFTLSFGVSTHAEVIGMIGKVIDGAFPVTISGKTLTNQAITIEGVSYVPVREFAESLGATVKFDASLGIEIVPTLTPSTTTSIPSPTSNPKYARYKQLVNEIGIAGIELQTLQGKITENKNNNQNVDDLNKQLSDKQTQYDKIVQEKQALEAELFPQIKK